MSSPINVPKKSLGQHWLFDVNYLDEIAETAQLNPGDNILEIGPGLGTLTEILLSYGANVVAVEYDQNLYKDLLKEKANLYSEDAKRLTLVNQDILKFDLTTLPAKYKVVANIPYYLTSNLIKVLSESANPPSTITLLVQKEVAERICAGPGSTSLLSIGAQFYYDCSLGVVVPAKYFTPPPKVDSQVVHMVRKPSDVYRNVDTKLFFRIVKAGFSGRRKTLKNALSGGLAINKVQAELYLAKAGINSEHRAQSLTLEQWSKLFDVINT